MKHCYETYKSLYRPAIHYENYTAEQWSKLSVYLQVGTIIGMQVRLTMLGYPC